MRGASAYFLSNMKSHKFLFWNLQCVWYYNVHLLMLLVFGSKQCKGGVINSPILLFLSHSLQERLDTQAINFSEYVTMYFFQFVPNFVISLKIVNTLFSVNTLKKYISYPDSKQKEMGISFHGFAHYSFLKNKLYQNKQPHIWSTKF